MSETGAGVSAPLLAVARCVSGLAVQQLPSRCMAARVINSFSFW